MIEALLIGIVVLLSGVLLKSKDGYYDRRMSDDINWLRKYFEKKSKNKWDERFYAPSNKNS